MQFHQISKNGEHVFGLLSAAGAAVFLAVRKLIKQDPNCHSTGTQSHLPDLVPFNMLKMKNPEVNEFSGKILDWNNLQVATQATLTSAGYDEVLKDDFNQHQTPNGIRKNQVVYSILCKACQKGNASHHIHKHHNEMDMNGA